MHTPFFSPWRAQLAVLGRRTTQALRQSTLAQLGEHLTQLIPTHLLAAEEEGPGSRDRLYSLRLTCECFLWQLLNPGTACREVVRQVQALCRLQGKAPPDEGTSAYIQARLRLPPERLERILSATAQAADQRAGRLGHLAGRPVKVVDGTTVQLPDTPQNQKAYPQPSTQKRGCGFPVMRLVVLFSLASGALLDVAMGNLHSHDLRVFSLLWEVLRAGDVVLGDRGFGNFPTLARLPLQGVDVVARLHQRRKVDFRRAKRLGHHDGLFVWRKNPQQSHIFSAAQWRALPEEITVRIVRFHATLRGFRQRKITLVTTLLDPVAYPAEELAALYGRRWRLELCLRDVKTTLGMEALRCQSPAMARKEVLAYLIAHNLVRGVMAEAALVHDARLDRLSFKGTLDALRQYSAALAQARSRKLRRQLWQDLLLNLVHDEVPWRLNRSEPRAVKRRPKPYPLLNQPRRRFVEVPHRNRYWNKKPRNYRALN
ncbi:MAG: hypothetical protein RLZZ303_2597 [Candidatus Hydrogenedentota bacterium]